MFQPHLNHQASLLFLIGMVCSRYIADLLGSITNYKTPQSSLFLSINYNFYFFLLLNCTVNFLCMVQRNSNTAISFRSSHSRSSRSFSPVPKKRKHHSPSRKLKKSKFTPEKYSAKDSNKSKKRKPRSNSRSNSLSVSPDYKPSHKKHYKEKSDKYYSPDRHSKKSKNGHYLSPTRERYEKYDRYEKHEKYDKYDKYRR